MNTIVPALSRGDVLQLEKPLGLPMDTPVMVRVLTDEEREAWLRQGDEHFASAFGQDEPEYGLDDLIP